MTLTAFVRCDGAGEVADVWTKGALVARAAETFITSGPLRLHLLNSIAAFMNIQVHELRGIKIAEVLSDEILISTAEEGLQLIVDLYYQDFGEFMLHERNITPDFFDLKTGIAGEILQKFTNYRVRVAIIGDFAAYPGQSLKDFIFESNKGRQVYFLNSVEEAVERLAR